MSSEGKLEKKQVGLRVELELHLRILKGFGRENDQYVTEAYIRALEEVVRREKILLDTSDLKAIAEMVKENAKKRSDKRKGKRAKK